MQKQRNRIEKKRFRGPVRASPPLRGTGRRIFVPLRRVAVCSAGVSPALCSRDGRTTSLRNATLPPSPPVSGERGWSEGGKPCSHAGFCTHKKDAHPVRDRILANWFRQEFVMPAHVRRLLVVSGGSLVAFFLVVAAWQWLPGVTQLDEAVSSRLNAHAQASSTTVDFFLAATFLG